jgi:hypothetical protein
MTLEVLVQVKGSRQGRSRVIENRRNAVADFPWFS